MRLTDNPILPPLTAPNFSVTLRDYLMRIHQQLNGIGDGRASPVHSASTAAPTTGDWAQGDFIRNSTPSEAGTAGAKYVVTGWICTVSGTPGTWVACRSLTGN